MVQGGLVARRAWYRGGTRATDGAAEGWGDKAHCRARPTATPPLHPDVQHARRQALTGSRTCVMSMDSGAPAAAAAGTGFSASAMARVLSGAPAIRGAWGRAARGLSCLQAEQVPPTGSPTAFIAAPSMLAGCALVKGALLGAPSQGGGGLAKPWSPCSAGPERGVQPLCDLALVPDHGNK